MATTWAANKSWERAERHPFSPRVSTFLFWFFYLIILKFGLQSKSYQYAFSRKIGCYAPAHMRHAAAASVVSNSVRPQRRQPTRFPRPWDS